MFPVCRLCVCVCMENIVEMILMVSDIKFHSFIRFFLYIYFVFVFTFHFIFSFLPSKMFFSIITKLCVHGAVCLTVAELYEIDFDRHKLLSKEME